MRISDWSSDVCSSDLQLAALILGNACIRARLTHSRAGDRFGKALCQCFIHLPPNIGMSLKHLQNRHDRSSHRRPDDENGDARETNNHGFGSNPVRYPHFFLCHRSEEHTSELQSLMRISYAVFCLKKKKTNTYTIKIPTQDYF